MENRRTRGRPTRDAKQTEKVKNPSRSSPVRKASPARKASPSSSTGRKSPGRKASPVQRPPSNASRRSSRTRSTAVIAPTPVIPPSPIKEKKEPSQTSSPKTKNEKPKASPQSKTTPTTTTTTNDVVQNKLPIVTSITTTSSSVHSSYSISTQKTTEIGSSKNTSGESELAKLTDFIRRSVSKTFSTSQRGGSQTPSTHLSRVSRSISQSNYDDGDYSKMEFSDSEEENFRSINMTTKSSYTPLFERTSSAFCRKIEVPKEFGGLLGASLLLLIVPVLAYYLPWCCRKKACEFKQPNLSTLLDLKYVEKIFNGQAVGSYVAYNSGVFVLSAALFGRFVRLPSDRPGFGYYFNGLPIAVLVTLAFGIAEYLKCPVAEFIVRHYLRFSLFSLLNALFVAMWCYVRSNYIGSPDLLMNPYAKTGRFIVDFCLGRQVNPKWFRSVDIKQVCYKMCWISTLLLAEIYILKNVQLPAKPVEALKETETIVGSLPILIKFYAENVKFDLTSLIASLMLLTYALDNLIFEHHLASSFELQHEGLGALVLLRYAATPFLLNIVPKYLFEHKPVALPNWAMIVMALVFLTGLVLKRTSNKIKYQYRINPNLATFNEIETVHTFQGRRLLLGSLWGRVRQPNHAGEILMLLSFAVPLCFKFTWPPLVSILLFVGFLLHRAVRVSTRNSSRYHSSWVRYCMKVRNLVVPKVF